MRLIIAGGRDYRAGPAEYRWLDLVNHHQRVTAVLSGTARGVDTFGEMWAAEKHIPIERYPAEWKKYGPRAGPMRNQVMVNRADALAVFPGGTGSANVTKLAEKAGIRIFRFPEKP